MFASLKNRLVRAIPVDSENGQDSWMLQISFEPENILVVADAKEAVPRFVHRRSLECFPSDACITAVVGSMLDTPVRLEVIEGKELELDTSVYQGLRKMPVDIFDNVYLDQVEPDALILVVDVRNFSNFLCNNREEDVFALIKDFTSNFLSCVNQFAFGCSYYKLMGDGAIIIATLCGHERNLFLSAAYQALPALIPGQFLPCPARGTGASQAFFATGKIRSCPNRVPSCFFAAYFRTDTGFHSGDLPAYLR